MTRDEARAAVRTAVTAEMAHRGWNIADLHQAARIDPGTVSDFLAGTRWPQIKTLGRIEQALGWKAGTIAAVLAGGPVPDVGGEPEDREDEEEATLRFRRPEGISDQEWDRIREEARGFIEWQIDRASQER